MLATSLAMVTSASLFAKRIKASWLETAVDYFTGEHHTLFHFTVSWLPQPHYLPSASRPAGWRQPWTTSQVSVIHYFMVSSASLFAKHIKASWLETAVDSLTGEH